jgi:hypothetical protein
MSDTPRTDAHYKMCMKKQTATGEDWLESQCEDMTEFARELERENERLKNALERIEEIFVDGSDTYDDWYAMGRIATAALTKEDGE